MSKFWKKKLSNINGKIGSGCVIHSHVWIGKKAKIGKKCKVQAFVFIPDGVELEDDVFIAPGVIFTNDKIPPSNKWGKILVKKGAAIGAGSVILPDVVIGERALVGAGSVVLCDIPADEVWIGNPARYLRKKNIEYENNNNRRKWICRKTYHNRLESKKLSRNKL
ncbi:MAG: acyltransferase [Patescibacteria group bacterium]